MKDLIRDTIFGHMVNILSGNRVFRYPEEDDPSLVDKYINQEKSLELQQTGTTSSLQPTKTKSRQEQPDSEKDENQSNHSSPNASADELEKGRDRTIIDWSEGDSDNPLNWSTGKKFFVTFQICFLTFSVYIGSAIYTAGILGVTEEFHVSRVAATLGLTLFVAGYGTGPMIWAPMSEIPQFGRNPV